MHKQGMVIPNDYASILLDTQTKLQTQILKKVSTLKRDFDNWERSFLGKNDLCAPRECDMDTSIADINRRIIIGNKLLKKWDIVF